MYESLSPAATRDMLLAVAKSVVDQTEMLTQVDQAIGDGDHGIGMRRGFSAVLTQLHDADPTDVEAVVKAAGTAIMVKTGGAAGAVFGTFFRAGSAGFAGREAFDAEGLATFLAIGLEAVEKRGGSRPGQKTMIDALAPAAMAAKAAISLGLPEALRRAAAAAVAGVEATKGMIATTGKARTLGERSLGHPDPGAVSFSLVVLAMRDFVVA